MNKKERTLRKMQLIELTESKKNNISKHRGGVFVHGDSYRHFIVKAAVFKILQEAGHEAATEVEFPNGRVADIVDLHEFNVYEIESRATQKDIAEKLGNFWDYNEIRETIVIDPEKAPSDLDELYEWLSDRVIA